MFLINYAGKAGTEKYVENLATIFTEGGDNCHLAYNIPGELSEKLEARGLPCLRLDMERRHSLSAAKTLAAYCREHGIEVIHAQYPRENIIALLSLRHYDVPRVVYTNHLTIRSGLRWRLLNKIFTPKNHRIIAVCREGRDIMIENGVCAEKIQVIYNGVVPSGKRVRDLSLRRELGIPDDAFVMSMLARYEPEKGLPFLVEALDYLRDDTTLPFYCLLCGDGSEYDKIGDLIRVNQMQNTILRLGYRSDTERVLRASDVYLNTSNCNEAMSFAILEAMNAGLPLVVTDVGGNRDLAETNTVCGFVVPPDNSDEFCLRLLLLMENEDLREEFSQNAIRKVAEEFDLRKLALDVRATYEK